MKITASVGRFTLVVMVISSRTDTVYGCHGVSRVVCRLSVDCLSMEQLSVCSTSSTFDFRHLVQFICSFLHCPLLPSSRGTKPQAWQCECEAFHSQCVYSTIVFWAYGKSVKWDWWWGDDGRFVYCVNQEHRRLPPGCLFSCRCRTSEHVGSRLTETQHRDCAMLKYFFLIYI